MFIQRSQTPHINNTGNVYRNIGNVFKNHITVIEKNYIAIHIDIELLSSPTYNISVHLFKQLNFFPILVFLYIEHT